MITPVALTFGEQNIAASQTSNRYGLVVKWSITPPCHGGDRRFKSGRARQRRLSSSPMGVFFLVCVPGCLSNQRSRLISLLFHMGFEEWQLSRWLNNRCENQSAFKFWDSNVNITVSVFFAKVVLLKAYRQD
jgi:hypothetical protein